MPPKLECGKSFSVRDELLQIGVVACTLHEEMDVVRHVAVHDVPETLVGGSAQKLRTYERDDRRVDEVPSSRKRTKRQGIPVNAKVVKARQVPRVVRHCGLAGAIGAPYVGPTKVGPYDRTLRSAPTTEL
jgi:hypothetical protein